MVSSEVLFVILFVLLLIVLILLILLLILLILVVLLVLLILLVVVIVILIIVHFFSPHFIGWGLLIVWTRQRLNIPYLIKKQEALPMSGHSKWKNIQHKKEKTDAQRAKIFTKIGREMAVVVKQGGPDPASNSKLKDMIAKAKANNVPNDNIDRIIKKAASSGADDNYESITYEGYGPCGMAVIVETLTDNRNRTAGDLRHYFDKFGGNMGQSGSVAWMFTRKGEIDINKEGLDPDEVMMTALEAGALDMEEDEGLFIVYTEPADFSAIREELADKYDVVSADIEMIPSNYIKVEGEENVKNMQKLFDALDDNDDVQNYWHNAEEEEE